MHPKLFDVSDNGRLIVTPNAYMIAETKAIIDKYPENPEPYLAYCHLLSAIDSPLRNLPEEEWKEAAIIDVTSTLGEFDETDPLLDKCIEKLKSLYMTPILNLFEGLSQEVNNILYYLKTTPISSDDLGQRISTVEKAGKLALSLAQAKKQAEEESKVNTRGSQEVGTVY